MTHLEARERLITRINQRHQDNLGPLMQEEQYRRTSPAEHYHMSKYPKCSYDVFAWLGELKDDPAIKGSIFPIVFLLSR